jgi:hypothetical protein
MTMPELVEVPLPAKVVRVVEVKEIQTPGPVRVVERVVLQSEAAPIAPSVIERIREIPVDAPPPPARVRFEGEQLEGVEDGVRVRGWQGWMICEIQFGEEWETLVRAPLDLETSEAVSVPIDVPPPPRNRIDVGPAFSTDGIGVMAGYSRRLAWRSSFGRAVLPDWLGGDLVALPDETAVLVRLGWEF